MAVYKVDCPSCHYKGQQYSTKDVGSYVMKCPQCMRGVTAQKIKTKGVIEASADGVTGYIAYDNKRHADS